MLSREDTGALAVIVAIFATAMFAFGTLVVEVGADREARRAAQSASDAAALAAAGVYDDVYDDTGGDTTAAMTAAFNAATDYAYENFPADRDKATYWDGCQADPVGGGTWVSSETTPCVAFRKGSASRHTSVQVVVPGLQTPRLLGAVAGKVRALAQASIPGLVSGSPFSCDLCVVDTFEAGRGTTVMVTGTARAGDIVSDIDSIQAVPGPPQEGPVIPPTAPSQPAASPGSGVACTPGVYVTITPCTSFSATGGEYVVTGSGANNFNASATNSVFYFTGGASLGPSNATIGGRTSGTYQGYAIIFDPRFNVDIDLGNGTLTVDGAFYAPSAKLAGNGRPSLVVHGPLLLRAVDISGSVDVIVGPAVTSRFQPVSTGRMGLVR